MTTVRIDGQDKTPPTQPTQMLSIPLNATSAINVHLMFQQQQQQLLQQQQQQGTPTTVSASTYVRTTPLGNTKPLIQPVAVNTASQIGIPIAVNQTTSSSIGDSTDNEIQSQFTNRVANISVGSEPDSARGSIPDDTNSVHSSGSRGTVDSLPDELARGMLTSLNLSIPNDDGIVTSPSSDNQEFVFEQHQRGTGSTGSHSSLSSPSVPVSPVSNPDEHHVQKKWSLRWEDEDRSNDKPVSPRMTDASSFILDDFTDEENRAVEDAESLKATTVAMLRGEEMTAMIKVKCSTEQMGLDLRVISLLEDILIRCEQLGKKMQGIAVRLTPFHLNKMKMADGRAAKELAAHVASILDGDLILCEAVCQKNAERLHVATDLRDVVYEKGRFAVGKLGIMVTLWKKHKYAVAAEFSEPLCSHIHFYRPHLLGTSSETAAKRKRKATDTVRRVFQSPTLLSQMFKSDPTMTVAEAARRSFVDIIFYALYE